MEFVIATIAACVSAIFVAGVLPVSASNLTILLVFGLVLLVTTLLMAGMAGLLGITTLTYWTASVGLSPL